MVFVPADVDGRSQLPLPAPSSVASQVLPSESVTVTVPVGKPEAGATATTWIDTVWSRPVTVGFGVSDWIDVAEKATPTCCPPSSAPLDGLKFRAST